MPRSKEPAVNTNIVYLIGLISVIALIGVLYLYTSNNGGRSIVGRPIAVLDEPAVPAPGMQGGATCITPTNGMDFGPSYNGQQVNLCFGTYYFSNGITVSGNNIQLICGGGVFLVGPNSAGSIGLNVGGTGNTINGCDLSRYGGGVVTTGFNSYFYNNNVHDNLGGPMVSAFLLDQASNSLLSHNHINSNGNMGIYILSSDNVTVTNTEASGNQAHGLFMDWSNSGTLTFNAFNNNGLNGVVLDTTSSHNTFEWNAILYNKANGVDFSGPENKLSANTISYNQQMGVRVKSNNNAINGNTISHNLDSQIYSGWDAVTITGNIISNSTSLYSDCIYIEGYDTIVNNNQISWCNKNGIKVFWSQNNQILSNTISKVHLSGIDLEGGVRNTLSKNTISKSDWVGIHLTNERDDVISNNILQDISTTGIIFQSSNYTLIQNNTISLAPAGIYLYDGSKFNQIKDNKISASYFGIELNGAGNNALQGNTMTGARYGLHIYGSANGNDLSGNSICGNTDADILCTSSGPTSFNGDKCSVVDAIGCGFTACPQTCASSGSLSVTSNPTGASYWLDNGVMRSVGSTPVVDTLTAGTHYVLIRKTGYYDFSAYPVVIGGQTTSVNAVLTRITQISPTPCTGFECYVRPPSSCPKYCVYNGKKQCCREA